jgi:hypothetical protein
MSEQKPHRDWHNLVGGYATGNLTPEERRKLMAAAVRDQEAFDALMEEEVLREVLADPGACARLRDAVSVKPLKWYRHPLAWGAVSAITAAVFLVAMFLPFQSKPVAPSAVQIAKHIEPEPSPMPTVLESKPLQRATGDLARKKVAALPPPPAPVTPAAAPVAAPPPARAVAEVAAVADAPSEMKAKLAKSEADAVRPVEAGAVGQLAAKKVDSKDVSSFQIEVAMRQDGGWVKLADNAPVPARARVKFIVTSPQPGLAYLTPGNAAPKTVSAAVPAEFEVDAPASGEAVWNIQLVGPGAGVSASAFIARSNESASDGRRERAAIGAAKSANQAAAAPPRQLGSRQIRLRVQ